jgi:hypothetical protein
LFGINSYLYFNNNINRYNGLVDSVETGLGTIDIVKGLLQGGIDLVDQILESQVQKQTNIDQLLTDMNTICPAVRENLCTDLDQVPESCNFDGAFDGEVLKNAMEFLANTRIDVAEELLDVRSDLEEELAVAEGFSNSGENFQWALYCCIAFSLALALLCLCLMVGVCFRLPRVVRCFQNWFLVPLFVLLVALSWAFSMAFVIGSLSLADFCVDSPDDKVLAILEKYQDEFSGLTYAFVVYYISGESKQTQTRTKRVVSLKYFCCCRLAFLIHILNLMLVLLLRRLPTFRHSAASCRAIRLHGRIRQQRGKSLHPGQRFPRSSL